jgi:hypothetical protein
MSFLLKNFEDTLHYLERVTRFSEVHPTYYKPNHETFAHYAPIFQTVSKHGDYSQRQHMEELATKLLADDSSEIRRAICYQFAASVVYAHENQMATPPASRFSFHSRSFTINMIPYTDKIIYSAFNIDSPHAREAWSKAPLWEDKGEGKGECASFAENLHELTTLEKERPGIGKVLQSEFKINAFARYPTKLLVAQYDQRNTRDGTPYGIVITAMADWNGSFYNFGAVEALYDQIQGKYRIKIYETEDIFGMITALNSSRKDYGKISFAIIGGHGQPDSITLGSSNLDKSQITRKGASALKLAFVEKPTIILRSCSTGALGGIGQEISKLDATVIAPSVPTSKLTINAKINSKGKIAFEVEYSPESSKKTYNLGILSNK